MRLSAERRFSYMPKTVSSHPRVRPWASPRIHGDVMGTGLQERQPATTGDAAPWPGESYALPSGPPPPEDEQQDESRADRPIGLWLELTRFSNDEGCPYRLGTSTVLTRPPFRTDNVNDFRVRDPWSPDLGRTSLGEREGSSRIVSLTMPFRRSSVRSKAACASPSRSWPVAGHVVPVQPGQRARARGGVRPRNACVGGTDRTGSNAGPM